MRYKGKESTSITVLVSDMKDIENVFSALLQEVLATHVNTCRWCYVHVLNIVMGEKTCIWQSSNLFNQLNNIAVSFKESCKKLKNWVQKGNTTKE